MKVLKEDIEILKPEMLKDLNKNFVFHGSEKLFSVCNPHKATDTSQKENNQFGIYATPYVKYAIMFAIKKTYKNKQSSFSVSNTSGDNFICKLTNTTIKEDAFGYVYCFNKKDFSAISEGVQYLCTKPIKPIKIYKVLYQHYKENFIF